jgi:hypothetical protein
MFLLILLLCLPLELISATPVLPDWTPPTVCATRWTPSGATIAWEHRASIRSFWLDAGGYTVSAASYTPRAWALTARWPRTGRLGMTEYSEGKVEGSAVFRLLWYEQYVPMIR